jgi:predicted nucleic acid-binding protein
MECRRQATSLALASSGVALAQRELPRKRQQRLPIPDLLIAACAHQHRAAVLHVGRPYDTLARVLEFVPVKLDA